MLKLLELMITAYLILIFMILLYFRAIVGAFVNVKISVFDHFLCLLWVQMLHLGMKDDTLSVPKVSAITRRHLLSIWGTFLWLTAHLKLREWSWCGKTHPSGSSEVFANTIISSVFQSVQEKKEPEKPCERPSTQEEPLYKQFINSLRSVSTSSPYVSLSHSLSLYCPLFFSFLVLPRCPFRNLLSFSSPPSLLSVSRCLILEQKASGPVMAYGYLTSASPLIRLSSLNDATCGATNAAEESIKAFH